MPLHDHHMSSDAAQAPRPDASATAAAGADGPPAALMPATSISASTATTAAAAAADTPQQLALLTRKASFVARSHTDPTLAKATTTATTTTTQTTKPAVITAPHLEPVVLAPERMPHTAPAFSFLDRIDRIEINSVRERSGVAYYVLDVFLFHSHSRLPTNVARHRSRVHATTPDFQVERRFSDFRHLRAQVYASVLIDPQCVCAYCTEFIVYVRLTLQQPRAFTKFTTGTTQRKRLLASFVNDFVRLGRCKWKQNAMCEHHGPVPHLLEAFVRGDGTSDAVCASGVCQ